MACNSTPIELNSVQCPISSRHDYGVIEMAVMMNNGDIWHYNRDDKLNSASVFMSNFMDALKKKKAEMLATDTTLIHSTTHNTTIYAHKSDA